MTDTNPQALQLGDIIRPTGSEWSTRVRANTYAISSIDSAGVPMFEDEEGWNWAADEGGNPGPWAVELVTRAAPAADMVNHPPHYTSDPSGVECIQITRHRNFNIGNAIKYLWRNGLKDDPAQDARDKQVEDLRKAVFYIEDEIRRIEAL